MKRNLLKLDRIARGADELRQGNLVRLRKVVRALARPAEATEVVSPIVDMAEAQQRLDALLAHLSEPPDDD